MIGMAPILVVPIYAAYYYCYVNGQWEIVRELNQPQPDWGPYLPVCMQHLVIGIVLSEKIIESGQKKTANSMVLFRDNVPMVTTGVRKMQ